MNFIEAEGYLNHLQMHKIKLGLEAMQSFLARVGSPEQRLRFVHVAGTNGKGSVCVTLLTALKLAGFHVGMYTSPHFSTVRERIRLNDDYISEEEFATLAERVIEVLAGETITYFEFTTAVALLWYEKRQPDLVILETGMGGRLDATNVVTPIVSLITSISIDHQAYLGDTLAAIASEKAGIIKENIPVVAVGGQDEVTRTLSDTAASRHAPLYLLGREFSCEKRNGALWRWRGLAPPVTGEIDGLECAMKGAYQYENAALAIAALKLLSGHGFPVDDSTLRRALLAVRWPGRLEFFRLVGADFHKAFPALNRQTAANFLLDGAHNPDGVEKLATTLQHDYADLPLTLLWGAMNDKDIRAGLARLTPLCRHVVLTRAEGERAAEPEYLLSCMLENERHKAILARRPADALTKAMNLADGGGLVVIAGSLYLLGELRPLLVGPIA
ncbi:MAG: bifunctional folylpolyglutamate synthase/dihydrofolate synthase [Desulfobulbaceae bacterium]|jgi:dihydrofolate synthase/folylpolyglutamate synthase|nr:bifunctional folylpolyglutamate synthase/dihydrofolate synthase [Desulfobulbaceae bacterium]